MKILNISRCKFGVQIVLVTRKYFGDKRINIKPGDEAWSYWNAIANQLVDTKWDPEGHFTESILLGLPKLTEVDTFGNEVQLSFAYPEPSETT